MPDNKNKGSVILPGMQGFIKKREEDWFWDGEKNERYFDATDLPDAPARQINAKGAQTYVLYVIFPEYDDLVRAVTAFTQGRRKSLAVGSKTASLNGIHKPDPDSDLMFLELWEQALLGIKPKKRKKVNTDDAQAPIE